MSRYGLLLLASFSLLLSACGNDVKKDEVENKARPLNKAEFPNIPQSVHGQWKMDQDEVSRGITYRTRFYINQNTLGVEIECDDGISQAAAAFAVDAKVGVDTIEVLQSGRVYEKSTDGRLNCQAGIVKTRFGFAVNHNVLTLSEGGSKAQETLSRIQ